jgi:Caspase domain
LLQIVSAKERLTSNCKPDHKAKYFTMIKKALIAGIGNYPGKQKLKGSVYDAQTLFELISQNGDEDKTKNFDATLLINPGSKQELKSSIMELFQAEGLDIALFYFAGHGAYDYFGYHMVTPDHRQHDRGIPMSQLLTAVRKSSAKNKIIILDCCHAGGIEDDTKTDGMGIYLEEGVTILASSKADEPSVEKNGHTVFSNLLIEALRGGAADLSGYISPGSIYTYIDKALGPNDQRPVFKANISGFVSLRKVEPPVPEEILNNLTVLFPDDPDKPLTLDSSFEYTNDPAEKHEFKIPYADKENVARFKQLQKLEGVGLVVPVGEEHMYWAAMNSKACKLTPLGQHYWRLANDKRK